MQHLDMLLQYRILDHYTLKYVSVISFPLASVIIGSGCESACEKELKIIPKIKVNVIINLFIGIVLLFNETFK